MQRKVRLKDVAERAGVAVNTASTILNRRPNSWASKETEARVFKAAKELGYRPSKTARALQSGRYNTIGLLIQEQTYRVGLKATQQIEFYPWPHVAVAVHRRHQPVITGVALHRDAQLTRVAVLQLGQIAQRRVDLRQGRACQRQQPASGGCKTRRSRGALDQRQSQRIFQRLQLMRHRRLCEMQSLSGGSQSARFSDGLQQPQMA